MEKLYSKKMIAQPWNLISKVSDYYVPFVELWVLCWHVIHYFCLYFGITYGNILIFLTLQASASRKGQTHSNNSSLSVIVFNFQRCAPFKNCFEFSLYIFIYISIMKRCYKSFPLIKILTKFCLTISEQFLIR